MWHEMSEGIRVVRRHVLLFTLAASSVTDHFFGSFYAALYSLYLLNDLRLTPFLLGVVISAGGVGSLVGSLFATPLSRRLGVGRAMVACSAASSIVGILTPLAGGPLVLATLMVFIPQLVGDAFQTVEWIAHDTVRQTVTPDRVLGRVSATIEVLSHGVAPFGALVAAAIAEAFGVRTAITIAWAGGVLVVVILALSPLPRMGSLDSWRSPERV